jgi:site-specific DNA recombinase
VLSHCERRSIERSWVRCFYLRALVQRIEVDAREVRIMGSKSALLRTPVAASGAKMAGFGVPGPVPKWRARNDSNVRPSDS